jgi:hypothetical protein
MKLRAREVLVLSIGRAVELCKMAIQPSCVCREAPGADHYGLSDLEEGLDISSCSASSLAK